MLGTQVRPLLSGFYLAVCFAFIDVLWAVAGLVKEGRGWREWEERSLSTHGCSEGYVSLAGLWNDLSPSATELPNS